MSDLTLWGYRPSVYTRVIRLVLAEKDLSYSFTEADPFDEHTTKSDLPHPFGRVPVLDHAGFTICETSAIARYLDAAFPEPALTPSEAPAQGRMAEVIALTDACGYWPLVRQVFAHRVFRTHEGHPADDGEIARGLAAATPFLAALEKIAREGRVLHPDRFTLADCHLAPMIAAFTAAPEGLDALTDYPALTTWWQHCSTRATLRATDTGFDVPADQSA